MSPSDLASIVELAQAALCSAVLEHLRMTRPSDAEGLHRVAWVAARCALAGHTECELTVPPALMRGGDDRRSVRDIVAELRIEPLLGLQSPSDARNESGAAAPPSGREGALDAPPRTEQAPVRPTAERGNGKAGQAD